MAKIKAPKLVLDLVQRFEDNEASYTNPGYNEASVRLEFLDPLFTALGWDVANKQGWAEQYKDVQTEGALKVGTGTKAPDYCFRVGGTRKFFVEAKRPGIDIFKDPDPAYQLRRYAWSAQLQVGVVANFRQLALYDCRTEPERTDSAATARVLQMTFREYATRWDELESILSRGAILKGAFDKYAASMKGKRGNVPVDRSFLSELDRWRVLLARNFASRNASLDETGVNFAVQQTIDRIVFLRISEDRGIEPYGQLQSILKVSDAYGALCQLFREADDKYNSGLFHFKSEPGRSSHPDTMTLGLKLDTAPLRDILKRLYYPDSPYEFSVLPPEILGLVYERFLGKTIRLTSLRRVVVEEKPEVKKAGGVYYTPSAVVSKIVAKTIDPWLANRKYRAVEGSAPGSTPLRVLDPACGSGTFLLAAYQRLLDWYLASYIAAGTKTLMRGRGARLFQGPEGDLRLTTTERKRILIDHIFGVDIDAQAVEVTKLSLLLKVLEGQSALTIGHNLQLFNERALPDLDANIRCGNSLVESDYLIHRSTVGLPRDEVAAVNSFDWPTEFPQAHSVGGFDVIVGNPPWLMAGYYNANAMDYFRDHYLAAKGKFDLYYLFVERAMALARSGGRVGMIVPNKIFHTSAAQNLREHISDGAWLEEVIDFGDAQIFEAATNYSTILLLGKGQSADVKYARANEAIEELAAFDVPRHSLGKAPWVFENALEKALRSKVDAAGVPLEDIAEHFGNGVQSGADRLLVLNSEDASKLKIESDVLVPVLRGRDVRRFATAKDLGVLVFPYKVKGGSYVPLTERELASHPHALRYLTRHRKKLEDRRWFGSTPMEKSGRWFGMMFLDDCKYIEPEHIVTPALSRESNFARNEARLFVTGTAGVTSVVLSDTVRADIRYVLGLLNSRLLEWYITSASPVYRGGYHKFSAPYIRRCPIRPINFANHADKSSHDVIVELVDFLESIAEQMSGKHVTGHQRTALQRQRALLTAKLDDIVFDLYGVTLAERTQIAAGVVSTKSVTP